ncbi:MAG: ATP-binding cassette domain-containing protein, partial [Lactobacillus iners]|nr:ATP-binding cassette domain-containing protein [Lactobacillus iners]
ILKLNDHLQQTVYSLSGGQKKRLQLLLMIMANPQVLLLDEPFTGLDCESITIFINLLKEYFIDKNKTVIIISHNLDQMDQLCQYHLQLQNQNLKFITN